MTEEVQARRLIALQYFARLSPKNVHFQWPCSESLLHIQEYLVDDLNLSSDLEEDVPYKKQFLKQLIAYLDKAVQEQTGSSQAEVNGDVLQVYANLMASSGNPLLPLSRKVCYFYPFPQASLAHPKVGGIFANWNCITLNEEASTIVRGTTGLKTWEASLRLAAHLIAQPEILSAPNLRVLELGSGSGLLGTVIAKQARQAEIHLTDLDGIVLHRLRETIDENLSGFHNVTVSPLDWLGVLDDSTASYQYVTSLHPHLIIAADIIYDPELIEPLCKVLKLALGSSNDPSCKPCALFASTVRNQDTYQLFLRCISQQGLKATEKSIITPKIDLKVGSSIFENPSNSSNTIYIDLFPSIHDACRDGTVRLIHVTN